MVRDEAGRLLVVLRAGPPAAGTWSLPGGRVEPGESAAEAAVREVREETGLDVVAVRHIGRVERPGVDGSTYVIDDFECRVVGRSPSSSPAAATDAADARFVTPGELRSLPCSPLLVETLDQWGALD